MRGAAGNHVRGLPLPEVALLTLCLPGLNPWKQMICRCDCSAPGLTSCAACRAARRSTRGCCPAAPPAPRPRRRPLLRHPAFLVRAFLNCAVLQTCACPSILAYPLLMQAHWHMWHAVGSLDWNGIGLVGENLRAIFSSRDYSVRHPDWFASR